jgi:hypothetical protein
MGAGVGGAGRDNLSGGEPLVSLLSIIADIVPFPFAEKKCSSDQQHSDVNANGAALS